MANAKIAGFKRFVLGLKKQDKIAVFYHRDADGFCSAVIAAKAIEKLRGKKPDFFLHQNYGILDAPKSFFSNLKKKRFNKVIVLDLSVDQQPKIIKSLEAFSDVLFIDHHKLYNDQSSKKTVFIKAQFLNKIDPSRYPASKLCFDLFNNVIGVSEFAWVSCVGILGDFGYSQWKSFFDETIKKNNISLPELKHLQSLIEAVCTVSEKKVDSLFKDFFSAKKLSDVLSSKHWKSLEMLESEVNFWFDSVNQKAEFFPGLELVFLEIKSKYSIKSPLINRLSAEIFPNQTVIVLEDVGKSNLFFSARRQDFKVKMNELLEQSTAGISGASAGGHIPAAAGKVPRRKLKKFRENVFSFLKKQ